MYYCFENEVFQNINVKLIIRMIIPKATFVNMLTVTIGSLMGIVLKNIFTSEIQDIVFQAVGLGTFLIGIKMASIFFQSDHRCHFWTDSAC